MKKVSYSSYGTSEHLEIIEVPKPKVKKQVRVKVNYSSLNAIDWKNRKGDFRLVTGWFSPKVMQGFDILGQVDAISDNVKKFKIGDIVLGQLDNFVGGAFSEYVLIPEKDLIKLDPENAPLQLAGLPMAGTTAWMALIKDAKLKAGQKVLINGGSSGVGHLAIQIAKAYGAEVTSVSSKKNEEFCLKIGADHTINYQKQDFHTLDKKYDIIFDVVFNSSYGKSKHLLTKNGVYIGTTPTPRLIFNMLTTKRAKFVAVRPNQEALTDMYRLFNEKKLDIYIDKMFEMKDIIEANKYMEQSRTVGKVIIKITKPE